MEKRREFRKIKKTKKAKMAVMAIILSLILGNFSNVSQAEAKAKKTNELSFTFSSGENPWSEKELKTLNGEIEDFYPLAKKVFGAPAVSVVVNIRKNPQSDPFFWQSGGIYEIVLPGTNSPHSFLHEMLHSFRGPYIIENNAFEEGMVRAAEVEIMSRLSKYDYDNSHHSYLLDVYYEANNHPAISAKDGKFYTGFINTLLRYQQAGYAWGKCLIEDKKFLSEFNEKYYTEVKKNPKVASDAKALKKIAEKVKKKVEGKSFEDWFLAQTIFDFSPSEGYQMFLKRDSRNVYIFQRDSDGKEKMLTGVPFSWKIYDYSGKMLANGEGTTNSNGWEDIGLSLKVAQPTKVQVEIEAVLPGGEVLKEKFMTHIGLAQKGIFGIILGEDAGTVQVTGKRASFEVPVVNGAFAVPETEDLAGTFRITYIGEEKNMTKIVTKDASGYYVVLDK